jgi:MscS family membrane protein
MTQMLRTLWQENTLSQWSVLLVATALSLMAGRVVAALLSPLAHRLERRGWPRQALVFRGLASPASLALLTLGLTIGLDGLRTTPDTEPLRASWGRLLWLLYSVAALWYLYNLIEVIELTLQRISRPADSTLARGLAPLVRKSLRVVLLIVGLLFVVESVFNQDIGAWLAGLGIVGLAVSLAAQDSLKNLFGSITILLDQPFRIGERIITTGCDGVVEEIGFRSTKVRTPSGSLVNIPNANLVGNTVENISRRPYICRSMQLAIPPKLGPAKIAEAIQIVRNILAEPALRAPIDTKIDGKDYPPRAYLSDITPDHLILSITYWYAPPNYGEYLEHAEKFNLRICDEFAKAGVGFGGEG